MQNDKKVTSLLSSTFQTKQKLITFKTLRRSMKHTAVFDSASSFLSSFYHSNLWMKKQKRNQEFLSTSTIIFYNDKYFLLVAQRVTLLVFANIIRNFWLREMKTSKNLEIFRKLQI